MLYFNQIFIHAHRRDKIADTRAKLDETAVALQHCREALHQMRHVEVRWLNQPLLVHRDFLCLCAPMHFDFRVQELLSMPMFLCLAAAPYQSCGMNKDTEATNLRAQPGHTAASSTQVLNPRDAAVVACAKDKAQLKEDKAWKQCCFVHTGTSSERRHCSSMCKGQGTTQRREEPPEA